MPRRSCKAWRRHANARSSWPARGTEHCSHTLGTGSSEARMAFAGAVVLLLNLRRPMTGITGPASSAAGPRAGMEGGAVSSSSFREEARWRTPRKGERWPRTPPRSGRRHCPGWTLRQAEASHGAVRTSPEAATPDRAEVGTYAPDRYGRCRMRTNQFGDLSDMSGACDRSTPPVTPPAPAPASRVG